MELSLSHILTVAFGVLITFLITDWLIKYLILDKIDNHKEEPSEINTGRIIGKCENLIILTFILAGEVTGLALIFAAKNIVRTKDIQENPNYFLAGTMINFTASMLMGFLIKYILTLLP